MKSRFGIALLLAVSLCVGAIRVPAATCILVNVRTEKACKMGCCANKDCCATSKERTGAPNQPLAASNANQTNLFTQGLTGAVLLTLSPKTSLHPVSLAEPTALSAPRLPLLCTFLI